MSETEKNESPKPTGSGDDRGFELKKRRRWPIFAALGVVILAIAGFAFARGGDDKSGKFQDKSEPITVSTFEANVAEVALIDWIDENIAPKYGIDLKFRGISDSTQLNRAVSEGEVGGTIYQHKDWLEQVLEANPDFREEAAVKVFRWAFGIWSTKHDSVEDIPEGGTITLPSDPANEAHALVALEAAGLIGLDPDIEPSKATQDDIVENPKNLKFKLLEYTAQARTIDDVDAAAGYNEVFVIAEIAPEHEIFRSPTPDAFIGQLTIGSDFKDTPGIKALVAAFSDPAIQDYLTNEQNDLPYKLLPLDTEDGTEPGTES